MLRSQSMTGKSRWAEQTLGKSLPKRKETFLSILIWAAWNWAWDLSTPTSRIWSTAAQSASDRNKSDVYPLENGWRGSDGCSWAQSQKHVYKTWLSRSIWGCGQAAWGGLQTLLLETFPTCEGARKGIYWETNKQTNQCGFVFVF